MIFYYVTVMNETYDPCPRCPRVSEEGILKRALQADQGRRRTKRPRPRTSSRASICSAAGTLLPSALDCHNGSSPRQVLRRRRRRVERDQSYNELLSRRASTAERRNRLHPEEGEHRPWLCQQLDQEPWPVVVTSDYMKAVPHRLTPWMKHGFAVLGTDGFGRSDMRSKLRHHFEVDAKYIALAALKALADDGDIDRSKVADAIKRYEIDPAKPMPLYA